MNFKFKYLLPILLLSFRAFAGPIVVMPSTTEGYVAGSSSGSASILPVKTLGAACVATPTENTGITADYSAVLTCNGGIWALHEAAWWRAPVASYAALPATGNSVGDARITTNTGRAFTWNGASWVPLAIDQNGNLSVPGNMSVTGTSAFTGAATFGGAVTANSSVTIGDGTAATATNTLVINRTATESTACSPNGAVARDANGLILSCQSGVWKKGAGSTGTGLVGVYAPLKGKSLSCSSPWYGAGGIHQQVIAEAYVDNASGIPYTRIRGWYEARTCDSGYVQGVNASCTVTASDGTTWTATIGITSNGMSTNGSYYCTGPFNWPLN